MYIIHHGVKGQKKGIRRYQNYDGTHTELGRIRDRARNRKRYSSRDNVYINGRDGRSKSLDKNVKDEIDKMIESNSKILIGDTSGADKKVQQYLANKGYKNVEVYTTNNKAKNNVGKWKVNKVEDDDKIDKKDEAMASEATRGLVISSKDNIVDNTNRLKNSGLKVRQYDNEAKRWIE